MNEIINFETFKKYFKWHYLVGFLVVTNLFSLSFIFQQEEPQQDLQPLEIQQSQTSKPDQEVEANSTIFVDIKGAIKNPGLYEIKAEQRLDDLIKQAGNFNNANTKCINLAQKLADEKSYYIPFSDESCQINEQENNQEDNQESKININTASVEQLMTLPGIGKAKAQAIVDHREQTGNFKQIDDLKNVTGIGEATFNNFEQLITL